MGLLKNKKGVEGLPFKYIIIALVAALVIGMALQFTGILQEGVVGSAERMEESLTRRTICELDEDPPVIEDYEYIVEGKSENGDENLTYMEINVTISDECGVKEAWLWFRDYDFEEIEDNPNLNLISGDRNNGTWSFTWEGEENFEEDELHVWIYARDDAFAENLADEDVTLEIEWLEDENDNGEGEGNGEE